MCGLCGEVRFDGGPVEAGAVVAMRDQMPHRGPDASGLYVSPSAAAGLGFRRLKIVDLSDVANQPMPNEDGSVQLVFNGEIYNFQGLRDDLARRGHRFRSRSDTEVIVHLYEEYPVHRQAGRDVCHRDLGRAATAAGAGPRSRREEAALLPQ
jgi:asparagine synthase (glutamine-hydrolysing)